MKKIIALFTVILTLAMLTFAASADTFNGTLVRYDNADPNLFFYNGKYYMTQTGTSRIAVFETEHVDELNTLTLTSNIEYKGYLNGTVYDPAIYELFGQGATIDGTWSPEIHYIDADMFGEDYAGWYMFLGLRKDTGDSSMVRNVVLKSTTDSPKGPYGHPVYGTVNYSQPLLDDDGSIHDEWACGQTLLTIPEGPYKGTYTMWISEEGRGAANGGLYGEFHQKIMIAKMKSPWQIDGEVGVVTTPTQDWEYAGASSTHPRVVEGATPIYGKNGEIFVTYSGSGYWSDYGLGQLTWNGGDPLETSSWVKLPVENGNPIFTATTAENLRGAGHASFLTDTDGNGFFCYHAYAYNYTYNKDTHKWKATNSGKDSKRAAFIEPYYIDYTAWNGVSYGVLRLGVRGDGVAANMLNSIVTFATDGEYLEAPTVYALGRTFSVTLTMLEDNAEGFIVYKSTDGEVFEYLTTTVGSTYVDEDVTEGETYYYRVYAYREEEIGPASEIASCKATTCSPYTESAVANANVITVTVQAQDNYDSVRLCRSTDGTHFGTHIQEIENVSYGETLNFVDSVSANGTYYYVAFATNGGYEYFSNWIVSAEVTDIIAAPEITALVQNGSSANVTILANDNYDCVNLYHSVDGITFSRVRAITHTLTKPGDTYTVVIDTVKVGTNYFYAVPLVDGYEFFAEKIYTVDILDLTPPSISKVESTCSSAKLEFASSIEYDSYTVYSVIVKYGYSFYTELATATEPKYTVENLNIDEEYLFAISGNFGGIQSDKSANVAVTLNHSEKNMPMLDATCTKNGYTAYTYCEYCEVVLSGKDVISASGHSYEETEAEIPATTTSVGKTAVYTCANCGDSYGGEEIPKLKPANLGDVTDDGVVNLLDVLRILKSITDTDVEINNENADIDGDGNITVADALAILKLALNK